MPDATRLLTTVPLDVPLDAAHVAEAIEALTNAALACSTCADASLAGGSAVVLDPLPSFADVSEYRIDPESLHVVYRADRLVNSRDELFAVPLDASAPPVRLSRPFDVTGAVQDDFRLAPGGRTFYRADHDQVNAFELYVDLELADALLPPGRAGVR